METELKKVVLRLFHTSDYHSHNHVTDNRQLQVNYQKLLTIIKNEYGDDATNVILNTGDISDDAQSEEFLNFSDMVKIGLPNVYHVPTAGNHDASVEGCTGFDFAGYTNFCNLQDSYLEELKRCIHVKSVEVIKIERFGSWFYHMFHNSDWQKTYKRFIIIEFYNNTVMLLLDSNIFTDSPFNFAKGEVGKPSLDKLKNLIATKYKDWFCIVCLHHNPVSSGSFIGIDGDTNSPFLKLSDSDQLLKIVWGKVELVCFGHTHSYRVWSNRAAQHTDGYMSCAPAMFSNEPKINIFEILDDRTINHIVKEIK